MQRKTFFQLIREGGFFQWHLADFVTRSVPPGQRVLMIGDERIPEVLAALNPSYGLGLMLPGLRVPPSPSSNVELRSGTVNDLHGGAKFDYVVFYESLSYEDKMYETFEKLKEFLEIETKVLIITLNPLSIYFLRVLRALGLVIPNIARNVLFLADITNLAELAGGSTVDQGYRFICPFELFGLGNLFNWTIPRLPLLRRLCIGQYAAVRFHLPQAAPRRLSCSVVVPCHNEEGNVAECIKRIPDFGLWREIIVVDDGSKDNTKKVVEETIAGRKDVVFITYPKNKGKGYAVMEGWNAAKGDVLMMLDCDMTSPPEELPIFHRVMEEGAEFINGTRIIYPRERAALAPLNRVGVTIFATLMSWILQQRISDTFCGTKVFLRKYWKYFDIKEFLWGDWDLFFMAKRYRLKMAEVPVHYMARIAGESKMRPFKHGWALLWASFQGLKIIP